jgi:hypothetical protein
MRPVSVYANGSGCEIEQLKAELPRRAVVGAEDETHLHLLPHVRASRTLRGARPEIPTPGKNRQVTVSWPLTR